MRGFYWLVPNVLAGCSRPGGRQGQWEGGVQLEQDLSWLLSQEIGSILTLTETGLAQDAIKRHGFVNLHIPVVDMTAPTPEQIAESLTFIDEQVAKGRRVVVHCLVGQGRTGTVLAAYLIRTGIPPERAIAELRIVCPHAVENAIQEEALARFAERRDWIL